MKFTIGDVKRFVDRTKGYIQYVNLYMVGYLYIEKVGFHWWHVLIIAIVFIVGYLDNRFVQVSESESIARKNPILMEIYEHITKNNDSDSVHK